MIEQAAADRVLFLNEASQAVRHVDLRFPEYVSTLRLKQLRRMVEAVEETRHKARKLGHCIEAVARSVLT
jgi:hypothetical protein